MTMTTATTTKPETMDKSLFFTSCAALGLAIGVTWAMAGLEPAQVPVPGPTVTVTPQGTLTPPPWTSPAQATRPARARAATPTAVHQLADVAQPTSTPKAVAPTTHPVRRVVPDQVPDRTTSTGATSTSALIEPSTSTPAVPSTGGETGRP